VRVVRLLALAGLGALLFVSIFSAGAEAKSSASLNSSPIPFVMVVRILSTDHYQVEVQNTNPHSFIKSFDWSPPGGLTVTAVTTAQGGTCKLDGLGGISCAGKALPSTCDGCVGSSMVVNFTATGLEPTFANGFWTYYGVVGGVQITGTTPIQKPTFSDLPTCAKGKKSTPSHLCSPA